MLSIARDEREILSVAKFNQLVACHLEQLGESIIEGEISQLQVSQGKWLFLTIKDDKASLGIFAVVYKIAQASSLRVGMKVQVFGSASLHQKSGRFSFTAFKIIPSGEGALRQAYEALKKKLKIEGLFETARKRKIVRFPQTIGLITAKDSRAYSDFVKIIGERMGGLKILFFPVQVQGDSSVPSLLKAFHYFNQLKNRPDAIVLTRGGGSLEDLISFNDERVARAVFASKCPVISAIGHEEDVALTDYVADLRASTPSNAAELLVLSRSEILLDLKQIYFRLDHSLKNLFIKAYEQSDILLARIEQVFIKEKKRFIYLQERFSRVFGRQEQRLINIDEKSKLIWGRLLNASSMVFKRAREKELTLSRILQQMDATRILARGYSITRSVAGKIVRSVSDLSLESEINTQLFDGNFVSKIIKINLEEKNDSQS